jgi:dienelactone hydrolase
MHWADRLYAAWVGRPRFFADGWGDPDAPDAIARHFASVGPPAAVRPELGTARREGTITVREGTFASPAEDLPAESRTARFELRVPDRARGAVLLLGSTGDEGYARRRRIAGPLAADGLATLILENPYYGARRPSGQAGCGLRSVADQLRMNRATVEEARALMRWLADSFGPVSVSGFSMGGTMAAYTAVTTPIAVGCVPVASGASAAPILTRDLLSRQVHWDRLGDGARERLAGIIEAVALTRMPPPADPRRAVILGCRYDGYVDPGSVEELHRHWPGSSLGWLEAGHVTGLLLHGTSIRAAIGRSLAG